MNRIPSVNLSDFNSDDPNPNGLLVKADNGKSY